MVNFNFWAKTEIEKGGSKTLYDSETGMPYK
jgi:hypothetical protein